MSLDNALSLVGILLEAAIVGLLIYRRVWRVLPVFCVYSTWILISNVGLYGIFYFFPRGYLTAYLTETVIESVLEVGILIELAWSVLRPFRASLPRGALVVVCALVLALAAAIWPFAVIPGFGNLPPEFHVLMRLRQTTSILRIVFFLGLAGGSQLLSIGWRDRELQVASGLGFYSLASLALAMLHAHLATGSQYTLLNQVEVCAYLCSLMYWVFSFSQKEAERRELSPQMQGFLRAVAGTARATRVAMTDAAVAEVHKRNQR